MRGTTFGPYRVEELLGRGGMGEVHRAHDTERGRDVALKLLPAHLASDTEYQERFRRECRAAARLNEPHIVPIHTFGEIDGRLFLDMRLVAGTDLAAWLAAHGAMAPEAAVSVVSQVAAALDAAHAAGLVHRDVKPSNILLAGVTGPDVDRDVFAYLFDFGIARARKGMSDEATLTRAGLTPGSLAVMAPERFSGVEGDPRADVYALACVLFQALTGRPPFEGDPVSLMGAHVSAPPPRPTDGRPELPPAFDEVVARGMAKDPDARPASAGALAAAARTALRGSPRPGTDPWRPTGRPAATSVLPPGWPAAPAWAAPGSRAAPAAHPGWGPPAAGRPGAPHGWSPGDAAGYRPPVPSPRSGRVLLYSLLGGVTLAAALVGAGFAVAALTDGEDRAPRTRAPASADPDPTVNEVDRLFADLPEGYGPTTCTATTFPEYAAIASVDCSGTELEPADPIGVFSRYSDVATMDAEFTQYGVDGVDPRLSEQLDDCDDGDVVRIDYDRGDSGRLLCGRYEDGTASLAWTDVDAVAIGVVYDAGGDIGRLYRWWQVHRFEADR